MFLNFDPTDDQKYTRCQSLVFDDLPSMYYLIYSATTDEEKVLKTTCKHQSANDLEASAKLIKVTKTHVILNVFLMIQKFTIMTPSLKKKWNKANKFLNKFINSAPQHQF